MKKIFAIISICLTAMLLTACGDMLDDIRQYIDKGETIYVGKIDSLRTYPGREKIEVRGNLPYGLTQTKCVISWTNSSGEIGSKTLDIIRTSPDDDISILFENMQEGAYEFTAITYDEKGNSSIPVTVNGYVYGNLYVQSLINRGISGDIVTSYEEGEFVATIAWLPLNYADALGTWLEYELAGGGTESVFVPTNEMTTKIQNAQPGGNFTWHTVYKPDPDAIDIFNTDETVRQSTTQVQIPIKNPGNPFQYDETYQHWNGITGLYHYGRFGKVKYWTTNTAADENGTWDSYGGRNSLSLWTYNNYSPVPTISDGKIYQTLTLPAGNYRFDVHMDSYSGTVNAYAAIATGFTDGLPDTENIAQAIASAAIPADLVNNALSVEFILTAQTAVSFGFVGDIGNNSEMNVKWVELWMK
jgi:hypothetical protein